MSVCKRRDSSENHNVGSTSSTTSEGDSLNTYNNVTHSPWKSGYQLSSWYKRYNEVYLKGYVAVIEASMHQIDKRNTEAWNRSRNLGKGRVTGHQGDKPG